MFINIEYLRVSFLFPQNCTTNAILWEEKDNSHFFNYNLASFCLFSLSLNASCSSIPCTMSLKMVVMIKDNFILLIYKIWDRKKL